MLFYECAAASTSANQLEANLVTRDLAVPVSETAASEQPAADGVQPMALSPGPAEQASAQAPPATPYNMPRGLYETILVSNLRQLGTMQLLSVRLALLGENLYRVVAVAMICTGRASVGISVFPSLLRSWNTATLSGSSCATSKMLQRLEALHERLLNGNPRAAQVAWTSAQVAASMLAAAAVSSRR
jgi:hypothetical protein